MNKHIKTLTASLLTVAILGTTGLVMAEENAIGAKAASEDKSYTLTEMLTYAIQDEYLAKAEYALIIDTFDISRPFTNIMRAEDRHIEELLPLFEAHGVPVPEIDTASHTAIPATLAETFAIGVDAEVKNIAMYDTFLEQDLPDDVRAVFENLKNGSVSHLAAFERGVSNDGTQPGAAGRARAAAGSQTGVNDGTAFGIGAGQKGSRGNRPDTAGQMGIREDCTLGEDGQVDPIQNQGANRTGTSGTVRGRGNGRV